MRPSGPELRETIERMEARLRTHPLFPAYERLVERFRADLDDDRDLLLSQAAVLMLLQEASGGAAPGRSG